MDGNEAAAYVAYRINEVCAIYPITPSSTMAELADQWASEGKTNLWGTVPEVVEMQSEGGAAGAVHGALQGGSLTTTFTASQGLMLMLPNMYKIAGELNACVIHVAARALAAQGLSIFGDHQDVMAARTTGFAMLASGSVQEAHDMALIAQAATLESRVPFIHFFDGFRTSHEVNKIELLPSETLRAMIPEALVIAHRRRALNPDHPFIRGTAQNPDVYFQGRESSNRFYDLTPDIVRRAMAKFAELTGRAYQLVAYHGAPDAERVIVLMGSGSGAAYETADRLNREGEKVGVIQIHLYRPFPATEFLAALPPTVKAIAVLDRTKEPGSEREPLGLDVASALFDAQQTGKLPGGQMPILISGRYGLASKEFHPGMVKAVFDELAAQEPKRRFTVGIHDDVTYLSLDFDAHYTTEPAAVHRAIFYGLGADGTVGANKNTVKIIGDDPRFFAQAYFVYDSKKSGSQTVSHLRFGAKPILSTYLIRSAQFIGCHQFGFVNKVDILEHAEPGATLLLNTPYGPEDVWQHLPRTLQKGLRAKKIRLFVIDASAVAREVGMANRTNTVMQACFFAISGVLPKEQAIAKIKKAIQKTYGKKGEEIVRKNFEAVDRSIERLHEVPIPETGESDIDMAAVVPAEAPDFVRNVIGAMMAGAGDGLPISALPFDGTYPSGTTKWEKRNIADLLPKWRSEACIQCGNCGFVCPHSAIRAKLFHIASLASAPEGFQSAPIDARGFPETRYTLQVYPDDCTGCGLCVQACPVQDEGGRAINMTPKNELLEADRRDLAFFQTLPVNERSSVDFSTVRGAQFLEPLFEFSGACAGCGETPYIKALTQLFGDRMMVANATGCSSIYGGNLPTTPWSANAEGRGPAWSNSLFEDNAEFGLGLRLAGDRHMILALKLLSDMAPKLGRRLVAELSDASQRSESQIRAQRARVEELKAMLANDPRIEAQHLLAIADHLVRRSVWIIGGDGWAYDIGSAGLDHVLASGRDVNILVLDTEVYSNTGGQASKSTPVAAVAKFANSGKSVPKKDLALQAIAYGNVYVARVAMGANPQQTLLAFREAEAYKGPSLILAYSHCIAHGIDMEMGLDQQSRAVHSGYWPLLRYNPEAGRAGENPFTLDSARPTLRLKDFTEREQRFRMLKLTNPSAADQLIEAAQGGIDRRWSLYEEMAARG